MDEKAQFSARLKGALKAAGISGKPADLEKLFNLAYRGKPMSYQGVRFWLIGKTMPEPDKLEVLAGLVGVDAQALRYGRSPDSRSRVAESALSWPAQIDAEDRIAISRFLKLPEDTRKIIRDIIHALPDA